MSIKPTEREREDETERERDQIPNLTEEILSHISFLAFKNAQLVFPPRLPGQIWLLEAMEGEAGGESPCKKSSSLQIHNITSSLHPSSSAIGGSLTQKQV